VKRSRKEINITIASFFAIASFFLRRQKQKIKMKKFRRRKKQLEGASKQKLQEKYNTMNKNTNIILKKSMKRSIPIDGQATQRTFTPRGMDD